MLLLLLLHDRHLLLIPPPFLWLLIWISCINILILISFHYHKADGCPLSRRLKHPVWAATTGAYWRKGLGAHKRGFPIHPSRTGISSMVCNLLCHPSSSGVVTST